MSDAVQPSTDQDPWERWNLKPYVPELVVAPVSLCVSPVPKQRREIAAYGEVAAPKGTWTRCDARMTCFTRKERGKFGRRSPQKHSAPCQNKAVVQVLYDDGGVAVRCKEHAP